MDHCVRCTMCVRTKNRAIHDFTIALCQWQAIEGLKPRNERKKHSIWTEGKTMTANEWTQFHETNPRVTHIDVNFMQQIAGKVICNNHRYEPREAVDTFIAHLFVEAWLAAPGWTDWKVEFYSVETYGNQKHREKMLQSNRMELSVVRSSLVDPHNENQWEPFDTAQSLASSRLVMWTMTIEIFYFDFF